MKFDFNDFGDGAQYGLAIVILHGLFGSGRNWASFAKHFSATVMSVWLNLCGH
jgi:pimeloyl-ACP methyl ester carboxylesterase